jgi:hypothetical protein
MGKTWTLLDLAVAVATSELALSRFAVAEPGCSRPPAPARGA